ncbi:MAG: bifunctional diaminohydroxyphosphoribosylaminopyrimidine deaminase/5-amino-6-(5-phosphoribosylamino)uracil reductase RibD [Candidatus Obscuribacterales bacterium]|nr:bifunctional diaminohydroxyphosphoribosylaminopyrimidine deaminase/5-amino-6-(5-phosphoribosylamino)uracil reductase RibD [Candidatus Obscuribacterales bacterium]
MLEQTEEELMHDCFNLALQAEGRTAPNPIVGAMVVRDDGAILGTGYHPAAGKPHAEVYALDAARELARGATLYVSLEPCCHYGKTPPCTEKIIKSGIRRVVAAVEDPNPKVSGRGFEQLRAAGIELVYPLLREQARWLNRSFIKTITTGMPWVVLKIASTLDGKIADRYGKSRWITGPEAREYVHELRNRLDCVMVGAATARVDDPELNVRDIVHFRHPKRAVVDTNLTIKPDARMCNPESGGNTIIYCSEEAFKSKGAYPDKVEIVQTPTIANGSQTSPERADLQFVLKDLKKHNVNSILCEGGGSLAGSLLQNDLVDEIVWIVAPAILGDPEAVASSTINSAIPLKNVKRFHHFESVVLGQDTLIRLTRENYLSDLRVPIVEAHQI